MNTPDMSDEAFFTIIERPAPKTRKPDARPLEKDVQKAIIAALTRRDIYVERVNAGHFVHEGRHIGGAAKGRSDLSGYLTGTGRAFFIEVKRLGETPSRAQAAFLAARRAGGALAGYADSVRTALAIVGLEPTKREQTQ